MSVVGSWEMAVDIAEAIAVGGAAAARAVCAHDDDWQPAAACFALTLGDAHTIAVLEADRPGELADWPERALINSVPSTSSICSRIVAVTRSLQLLHVGTRVERAVRVQRLAEIQQS
jgi:hypothetical protein